MSPFIQKWENAKAVTYGHTFTLPVFKSLSHALTAPQHHLIDCYSPLHNTVYWPCWGSSSTNELQVERTETTKLDWWCMCTGIDWYTPKNGRYAVDDIKFPFPIGIISWCWRFAWNICLSLSLLAIYYISLAIMCIFKTILLDSSLTAKSTGNIKTHQGKLLSCVLTKSSALC